MSDSNDTLPWERIWGVFHEALALAPDRREALMARELAGEPRAREEVRRLVAAHETGTSPLDQPAVRLLDSLPAGMRIGDWRLLEPLGDGGMGTVYVARRSDGDYEQLAAIKLVDVPPGQAPLFAAERRALAKMRHPDIAQLYDSGVTEQGHHYLVMEYVDGERLDAWLRRERPGLGRRLALFARICRAVHHAHRNLIVHSDLKPSNVLVAREGGGPKLVDFGVASAPGEGGAWLTPAHASPEQLRGEPVTTASDVFALGLLLHGMVADEGDPLVAPTQGRDERAECLARGECGDWSLSRRRSGHALLGRCSRFAVAELDAILAAALAPKPEQRYPSAEALADDVERWLRKLPLRVRGDRPGYRLRLATARHPLAFSGAALLLTVLLGLLALLAHQGHRLSDALVRAEAQAQRAADAAGFLGSLFTDTDPEQRAVGSTRAIDVLHQGAARLTQIDDAALRAELAVIMGRALRNLGEFERADVLFADVLARSQDRQRRADALQGRAAVAQARGSHAAAESMQREAIELLVNHAGDEASGHEALWYARLSLAAMLQSQGRLDEAAQQLEGVAQHRGSRDLAGAASVRLGAVAWGRGDLRRAEAHYREALEHYTAAHGTRTHQASRARYALATAMHKQGLHDDARAQYEATLELDREIYGERHPRVVQTMIGLAALAYDAGDARSAAALGTEVLEATREVYGQDSLQLAPAHNNLALALHDLGRFDEAQVHYERALALHREQHGAGHARVVGTLANMVLLGIDRGRASSVAAVLADARAAADALPDAPMLHAYLEHLEGRIALERRDLGRARVHLQRGLALRERLGDGRHPLVADSLYWMAWLYVAEADHAQALVHAQRALEQREGLLSPRDWRIAQSRAQVGALRQHAGDTAGARMLGEALETLSDTRGTEDWQLARLRRQLAALGVSADPVSVAGFGRR